MSNFEIIAKFGGTSVARPDLVRQHVNLDDPDIVVVSAVGQDRRRNIPSRVTELLRPFALGNGDIGAIRQRHACLIDDMGFANNMTASSPVQQIFESLAVDIETWRRLERPPEPLGEYWSARLYGLYLDREFVNAAEVVRTQSGQIDVQTSEKLARARFVPGKRYIVPGDYGADDSGKIQSLGSSGSDTTAALLARVLDASECHIWSDVDGYMTADPALHDDVQLMPELTIEEAMTWAQSGCRLVHPEVYNLLGDSAVNIVVRNTFGPSGNRGTAVVRRENIYEYDF